MKAEIKEETLDRLSQKSGKTITRGVDRAVNDSLDELEKLQNETEQKNGEMDICVCNNNEKLAEGEEKDD